MFRKPLTSASVLLLAGVLFVLTSGSIEAAGGHGGHAGGGGFHSGGAGGFHAGHVGVAHAGGYHGGFYHGGYHGYHGGYYGHAYAHYGYRPYGRYGYRGYYGGFGGYYYPYYGGYSYYPYFGNNEYYNPSYLGSYDPYANAGPAVPYFSGYDTDVLPPAPNLSPSPAASAGLALPAATAIAPSDDRARLTVTVPAAAQLWINFTPTTSTGPVREFQSPPLTPGVEYSYTVHARWYDQGREVDQTQRVEFTAGSSASVRFPVPAESTVQVPAGAQS
jgi:uncharacterized protein (TIGR03000 family)